MSMKKNLEELLNIYAPSREEEPVRRYLKSKLDKIMDKVEVDSKGNLLAEKTFGSGKGATVMFSAHMDTVPKTQKDKIVKENKGVYTAVLPNGSRTILGADDRAGIAIILEAIEGASESFDGIVKVAFTVEEEIGCIGSSHLSRAFYKDVDLAIVVDRRGSRDMVIRCFDDFCSKNVMLFLDDVATLSNLNYQCVDGGISDAVTYSDNGINSVNLSAGYYHEHSDEEFLVFNEMEDTVKLIEAIMKNINAHYKQFGKIEVKNYLLDMDEEYELYFEDNFREIS